MDKTYHESEKVWRNLLRLADRLNSAGVPECDLPNRLPLSQLRVVGSHLRPVSRWSNAERGCR